MTLLQYWNTGAWGEVPSHVENGEITFAVVFT